MVAAGWWLATGAPLKKPQAFLSRNTAYHSSVLGYLPAFLSVAIRTREHPGSWAAQCPTFRESCLDHWHTELLPALPGEQAQVDELPWVAFHFQLVFMEVEVLHWQLFTWTLLDLGPVLPLGWFCFLSNVFQFSQKSWLSCRNLVTKLFGLLQILD